MNGQTTETMDRDVTAECKAETEIIDRDVTAESKAETEIIDRDVTAECKAETETIYHYKTEEAIENNEKKVAQERECPNVKLETDSPIQDQLRYKINDSIVKMIHSPSPPSQVSCSPCPDILNSVENNTAGTCRGCGKRIANSLTRTEVLNHKHEGRINERNSSRNKYISNTLAAKNLDMTSRNVELETSDRIVAAKMNDSNPDEITDNNFDNSNETSETVNMSETYHDTMDRSTIRGTVNHSVTTEVGDHITSDKETSAVKSDTDIDFTVLTQEQSSSGMSTLEMIHSQFPLNHEASMEEAVLPKKEQSIPDTEVSLRLPSAFNKKFQSPTDQLQCNESIQEPSPLSTKCPKCHKQFAWSGVLKRHIKSAHCQRTTTCKLCHKRFERKFDLKTHLCTSHSDKTNTVTNNIPVEPVALKKCPKCPRQFTWKGLLRSQLRKHHGQNSVKCELCNGHFGGTNQLARHMLKYHSVNKKKSLRPQTLLDHVKKHCKQLKQPRSNVLAPFEGEQVNQCQICLRQFSTKSTFLCHVFVIHLGNCVTCKICNKKFGMRGSLKAHVLKAHMNDNSSNRCGGCGKSFPGYGTEAAALGECSQDGSILEVCKTETGTEPVTQDLETCASGVPKVSESVNTEREKPKRKRIKPKKMCEICGKMVTQMSAHMLIHQDIYAYKCKLCSRQFKHEGCLRVHVIAHSSARTYKCHLCDKNLKHSKGLKRHLKIHSDKSHKIKSKKKCTECKRYYEGSYEKHAENVHLLSGAHLIKCNVCDKIFSNKTSRDGHMNVHNGLRPYVCDFCGKTYQTTSTFSMHMKSHAAKLPCEQCGKLVGENYMKTHLAFHSDAKPHQCKLCGKGFKCHSNLVTHMASHSSGAYSCDLCDRKFKLPHQLRAHVKTH